MADLTKYPQASDVDAVLTNTGLSLSWRLDYTTAASAAVAEWEKRTGWYPFLAVSDRPVQRLFDPPGTQIPSGRFGSYRGGREMDLGAGILESQTCTVQIGYVPGPSPEAAPVSAGVALIQGIQYYLRPNSAEFNSPPMPYTQIEFLSSVSGIPQSISVWAKWGRVSVLPADVWLAICRYGAFLLGPEISLAINQGRASFRGETIQEQFAAGNTSFLGAQMSQWEQDFKKKSAPGSDYVRVVT